MNSPQLFKSRFLVGDRIYLREVRLSDVNENYYEWMNDPEVTQYLESRFFPNSQEALQQYVREKLADRNNVFLAIVLKEDDRHIGNIKLGPINWIHRSADVGILIGDKKAWGKGCGTEAVGLVTDYAFNRLNLHSLSAGCYAPNVGSLKAFLKAGWKQVGRREQACFWGGREYVDLILLAVSKMSYPTSDSYAE